MSDCKGVGLERGFYCINQVVIVFIGWPSVETSDTADGYHSEGSSDRNTL